MSGSVHFIWNIVVLGLHHVSHNARNRMQVRVDHRDLVQFGFSVLRAIGCDEETANEVCPCVFVFLSVCLYFFARMFVVFCLSVCIFLPVCLYFFACMSVFPACLYFFTRVFVFLCLHVCISLPVCLYFFVCVLVFLPVCLYFIACVFAFLCLFFLPVCFVFFCRCVCISLPVCLYFFAWATVRVCIFAWICLTNCARALADCVFVFMIVFE